MSKTITVGTYGGAFREDTVMAIALIKCYCGENIKVTRTEDNRVLAKMDLVVGTGGEFSPKDGRFDHHQFNRDNVPHNWTSSAGLVMRHYRVGTRQCNECRHCFYATPINTSQCKKCGSYSTFGELRHLSYIRTLVRRLVRAIEIRSLRSKAYSKDGEFEPLFDTVKDCNLVDTEDREQDTRFTELVDLFALFIGQTISYTTLCGEVENIRDRKKQGTKK